MEFQVKARELTELLKRTKNANTKLTEAIRYKNEDTRCTLPAKDFEKGELEVLRQVIDDRLKLVPDDRHNKWVRGRLKAYFELLEGNVSDTTRVTKLQNLPLAMKKYLEKVSPRRWVFTEQGDKTMLPWFVTNIEYHKRRRSRDYVQPAYVSVSLRAYKNGTQVSKSEDISEHAFKAAAVNTYFTQLGLTVETDEAVTEYKKDCELYGELQNACGKQMYAIGLGSVTSGDRWYRSSSFAEMVRNGYPTKVVVDATTEECGANKDSQPRHMEVTFWEEVADTNGIQQFKASPEGVDDEDGDDTLDPEEQDVKLQVALPIHPYVNVFDLEKHSWVNINTNYLQPYEWDKKLLDKLVLPKDQKDLLQILIQSSGNQIEDIVRGKMSGVIVLATGKPGVGKTLTAEVFSEYIEKPLYNVQCSQLGLDVDDIEKNLGAILTRASRWGAVMLIDEADVYIRRRGEDITQNAIVGVFLRLLEYYRGVLFMTSNRGNIVDDAILSRATAWIQYELPTADQLKEIWTVLAKQYQVELTKADIGTLLHDLPNISGRTVRNVLKLATMLRKEKVTAKDIVEVAKYQSLESKEGN